MTKSAANGLMKIIGRESRSLATEVVRVAPGKDGYAVKATNADGSPGETVFSSKTDYLARTGRAA